MVRRASSQEVIVKGTVRRVIPDRGFGFVAGVDGTEFFFHRTAAPEFDSLAAGDLVTFIPGEGEKGPRASDVTKA
jgi:CspA family cold shock protein